MWVPCCNGDPISSQIDFLGHLEKPAERVRMDQLKQASGNIPQFSNINVGFGLQLAPKKVETSAYPTFRFPLYLLAGCPRLIYIYINIRECIIWTIYKIICKYKLSSNIVDIIFFTKWQPGNVSAIVLIHYNVNIHSFAINQGVSTRYLLFVSPEQGTLVFQRGWTVLLLKKMWLSS